MPNWCENNIHIFAKTPNDLLKFVRKYLLEKGGKNGSLTLDFNRIVPEPKTIKQCPPQFRNNDAHLQKLKGKDWFNWYDWRCVYWGTKWNADDCYINIDSIDEILKNNINNIDIYVATAWTPPIPLLQEWQRQAQAMNPDILITSTYYECGMCFAGELLSDGSENELDFNQDDKEFREWTIHNGYETEEFYEEYDAEK